MVAGTETAGRCLEPAPGIFRLVLPLSIHGVESVNVYLLRHDDGAVLVDCGADRPEADGGHGLGDLTAALEACGASLDEIRALVVTHPHIDHYGLAHRLVEATGAEVWMHPAGHLDFLAFADPDGERARLRRVLSDHGVEPADIEALSDVLISDWAPYLSGVVEGTRHLWGGEELRIGLRLWEVVFTPGHSRAHLCLWLAEDRILFSGDHLLPGIASPINFHHGLDDDPLGQYLDSLERIEALDPGLVLPGHGRPFTDGARRARAIIESKERRLLQTLQAVDHDALTVKEITERVYAKAVLSYQVKVAMSEALAHVACLRKRRLVTRSKRADGAIVFRKSQQVRT
jgi:glyoxylase-like metal-dependent hydrolase (beta-lactamase superfamily II)